MTRVPLAVLAPVPGRVLAMADVPDPVFAGKILGPGLAIDPPRDGVVDVVAPVSGQITKLCPHAFVVITDGAPAILVHLGLDTVELAGAGFVLRVAEGDAVEAGDLVTSWRPGEVAAGGRSPICPVVALHAEPGSVAPAVVVGTQVRAGEALFRWT